ncbi:MAG: FxLYD domain-containing protein [Vicinamibacteria bacterium]
METLLLIVTVVSLTTALVMAGAAWRMARVERERSAARVAALRTAAQDRSREPWPLADELPLRHPVAAPSDAPALFAAPAARPAGGGAQRGLAIAAAALLAVMAGAGLSFYADGAAPSAPAAAATPLELVDLRHARASHVINISGVVRNPDGGAHVQRLEAVVTLFDGDGATVATGQAPVDYLQLGPGDDTPFVVSVEAPASATRYRVSFRTAAGLVPHVDRRTAAPATAAADARPASR